LPTDDDAVAVDERHREDRVHRGRNVAQGTIRAGQRLRGVAGVAERTIQGESLVVQALRAGPPASGWHHHRPATLHEELRQRRDIKRPREQARVAARGPVVKDERRHRPGSGRLIDAHLKAYGQ
jgi:hypothetical protein